MKKSIVTKACDRCKIKKRRCDGMVPCVSCEGLEVPCTYEIQQKKRGPIPYSEKFKNHEINQKPKFIERRRSDSASRKESKHKQSSASDTCCDSEDYELYDSADDHPSKHRTTQSIIPSNTVMSQPIPKLPDESQNNHITRADSTKDTQVIIKHDSSSKNKAYLNTDIKKMIKNYSVTSSISKLISNTQLLDSVSEFFLNFNATFAIFENPAEIIQKIISNSLPLSLLASLVCVGSCFQNQIDLQTSSHLAEIAHSHLSELQNPTEIIQSVLLLQFHELAFNPKNNAWIYNGISTNLINENQLQLKYNEDCRLKKAVIIADFFHCMMTGNLFETKEEDNVESIVNYPQFKSIEADFCSSRSSDFLQNLFVLVKLCKNVYNCTESLSTHYSILQWWDNHEEKLVPSLNALASGGKLLIIESSFTLQTNQDPANMFCHLLFFRFLSEIHQKNNSLQTESCLFYPTSTKDRNSCLATSLDILAACYRAQNALLRLMYQKKVQHKLHHVFGLTYLPELLIPCAAPLMRIHLYSTGLLLGSNVDMKSGNLYARLDPCDLIPLSALFVPALEENALLFPGVADRVIEFKKAIDKAQAGLVWGSVELGQTKRADVSEVQDKRKNQPTTNRPIIMWGDCTIDGIGNKTVECDFELSEKKKVSRFNFELTDGDQETFMFCDSLLDFGF